MYSFRVPPLNNSQYGAVCQGCGTMMATDSSTTPCITLHQISRSAQLPHCTRSLFIIAMLSIRPWNGLRSKSGWPRCEMCPGGGRSCSFVSHSRSCTAFQTGAERGKASTFQQRRKSRKRKGSIPGICLYLAKVGSPNPLHDVSRPHFSEIPKLSGNRPGEHHVQDQRGVLV